MNEHANSEPRLGQHRPNVSGNRMLWPSEDCAGAMPDCLQRGGSCGGNFPKALARSQQHHLENVRTSQSFVLQTGAHTLHFRATTTDPILMPVTRRENWTHRRQAVQLSRQPQLLQLPFHAEQHTPVHHAQCGTNMLHELLEYALMR